MQNKIVTGIIMFLSIVLSFIRKNTVISTKMTWLPEKYAKIGTNIKLKRSDGSWDTGWEVIEVYTAVALDEKIIDERSQDYKKQRKASDI